MAAAADMAEVAIATAAPTRAAATAIRATVMARHLVPLRVFLSCPCLGSGNSQASELP